jgi:hypothetical protein
LYSVISEYNSRANDGYGSIAPECFSAYITAIEMKREREK